MGKKRSKPNGSGSKAQASKGGHGYYSADSQDDEVETNCSESDMQSVLSNDEILGDPDQSSSSAVDALHEKFSDSINLLESRTASDREKSLNYICSILSSSFVPDLLENLSETLCSAALKCLTKGKKTESKLASNLLLLLFVQLGADKMSTHADEIRKGLLAASNNVNHSMESRGRFFYILSLCSFFSLDNEDDGNLLDSLETVVCGTMKKEVVPLVAWAFESWCVLAIQFRAERIVENSEKLLFRVLKIFEEFQDNKELRLGAGKMVALIYETFNNPEAQVFRKFQKFEDLYDLLEELSKKGSNVVSKRDKKAQKSSLREAISYMDGESFKAEVVKFGKETLVINSYSSYLLYEAFKEVLGTGVNKHLAVNPTVRTIFDLSEPGATGVSNLDRKTMKERMKGEFSENDKARTLYLRKQRGKRTDHSYD
ncbi:interferon-related developmental regulator 2-like [Symsagittifera roscoffensis]|uniref:interferon-related developmental regulator 2-like n=1 Tax=Symsagittifera roscoffensis TaxID=84072 RepID=UPI00307B5504